MKLHPEVTNKVAIKRFQTLENEFMSIHGNRYDYSQVEYKSVKEHITIICSLHGAFKQRPADHLRSKGCKKCAQQKSRCSLEEFITKAKTKHKQKYDYTKVKFTTLRDHITIICPQHGEFKQRADHHLDAKGCKYCGNNIPTTEEFIQKAKEIHGDKYDYSKVEYVNRTSKIKIKCAVHGDFLQSPSEHLAKYGCQKCAGNIKKTNQKFIEDANKRHNNKYDYSKTEYKSAKDNVVVICPIHQEFSQTANTHLSGSGCPKCGNNIRTNDEYIQKAHSKHNNKYDYSKTNFIDTRKKIIITCSEHGDFLQTAGDHHIPKGCPGCAKGGFDSTKPGILYYLSVNNGCK